MKILLLVALALLLLAGPLTAQDNKASVLLSSAIYEEEVSGNLDKAIELYLDILKKYPDDRPAAAKALYHLGLVNEKMGKQKAGEYFTRLVKTYPDQKELVSLAKAKLTRIDSSTSEATLKAEQSFRLAGDLFKQFKFESAAAEYEKLNGLAPKSQLAQEARLWIGQCYFKLGKYNQALASFNSIIKEFPQSTIVPVTELMIGQVKLAIGKEPKKSNIITLDDKTILDPATGIRYTKINTWTGKNDLIKSAVSITDISPNRKFLLAGNKVFPFNNGDPIEVFETPSDDWSYSRLSPDATKIAFMTDKTVCVRPVSPETGQPTGQVIKIADGEYRSPNELSWSPGSENLVLSLYDEDYQSRLATIAINDTSIKPVTNSFAEGHLRNPVFSNNGSNILYLHRGSNFDYSVKMNSCSDGKSVTIIDSCLNFNKFILSPDNLWILYKKTSGKSYLFRLADKQKQELSTPEEVGDFVSWADKGSKVFFYCPSFENQNAIKVASVFGGPAFELGKQFDQWPVGWSPGSNAIIAEKNEEDKKSLSIINLADQVSKVIDGISDYEFLSFSKDYSNILVANRLPKKPYDLSVFPVSLKDCKVTGNSILIFKGFKGYPQDISWSPDGKKIAVCHGGEVWICNAEGGDPLQLTRTSIPENFPLWSPDGKAIAVFIRSTTQLLIISSLDGHVLRTFENVEYYDWKPNGNEIIIAFHEGQLSGISLASDKIRKIANWKEISNSLELLDLKCSPDGNWIAIQGYDNKIAYNCNMYLINAADGKATELAANDSETKEIIIWSPDSKWISFYSEGPKKMRLEGTLWEADLTGFMNKMKPF